MAPRTDGTNDWMGTVIIPLGDMNATSNEVRWYRLGRDSAHLKNEFVSTPRRNPISSPQLDSVKTPKMSREAGITRGLALVLIGQGCFDVNIDLKLVAAGDQGQGSGGRSAAAGSGVWF